MTSSETLTALIEKIKRALEAGEMIDAADLAQEAVSETRRLGIEGGYYLAEMLSLIGNTQAERGLAFQALQTLDEADAEWARYEDDQAKWLWLARNAQYRAMALRATGRLEESLASSAAALRMYRAAFTLSDDPAAVTPEEALELISAVAAEVPNVDPETAETLGTISFFLVRVCSNTAQVLLSQGEVMRALPWLEVVYLALERVNEAQRKLVHVEALSVHQALFMTLPMLAESGAVDWTEETFPPEIGAALDRLDVLGEEPIDLSGLPGARSFDTRFMLTQTQRRSEQLEEAAEELKGMLADFGDDPFKRATILVSLARVELDTQRDIEAVRHRIVEALNIATALAPDGDYHLLAAETLLAEVSLRSKSFDDARTWAASALARLVGLAEPDSFEPLWPQLLLAADAYRGLGNAAAGVFFAKLAAGATAGVHRTLERVVPLMASGDLPSGHAQAADRLRQYLIEDGRLGEALTAGLLPIRGPLPPTTPTEGDVASQFLQVAKDAKKIDAMAIGFAEAEARHVHEREALQQEELELFRDVIPWNGATTFLHYNPTPDALQVVIATPERLETWTIPVGAQQLASVAFNFLESLVAEQPFSTDAYDVLLRPIEEQLASTQARCLVVAGGDFLRFLPFAALFDGRHYLVERYAAVSWAPPAAATLKQPPRSHTRVVMLGYERGRGGHEPLWSVPDELLAIARACRAHKRVSLPDPPFAVDATFTASALADALGGGADILHVATHFDADPADARASRLVLGDDSLFSLGDLAAIMDKRSGLDLCALAACSTGLPAGRAADANVSAAAVLHAFGVRSVVSTLWPVRSPSTAILMDRFYRGLFAADPADKAETLRQAQLDLLYTRVQPESRDDGMRGIGRTRRKAITNHSHPHYWAPFILSGNWLSFPLS